MPLREIMLNGQPILVEVADLTVEGEPAAPNRFENTDLTGRLADMKDRIGPIINALAAPVQAAMKAAGAAEWSIEVNIGFKGETGVPFLAAAEANAAVKVSAKWKAA